MNWNRRFANGFMFGASYTFSRSWDDSSNQRDILPNTYDAHNMWALSSFDVTHIMMINYLYDLPFFRAQKNLAGKLLGGWQLSGTTQLQTGTTCSGIVNNDYAGVGVDGNVNDCGLGTGSDSGSAAGQFWNVNGDPEVIGNFAAGGNSDTRQWFRTTNPDGSAIFTAPAKGTFASGPISRDFVHIPGIENWNIGLYKKFAINERMGFQFRAEAFNVFNHPNLAPPATNPNNAATFGKVTGKTNDSRNLQLSLRFYF